MIYENVWLIAACEKYLNEIKNVKLSDMEGERQKWNWVYLVSVIPCKIQSKVNGQKVYYIQKISYSTASDRYIYYFFKSIFDRQNI